MLQYQQITNKKCSDENVVYTHPCKHLLQQWKMHVHVQDTSTWVVCSPFGSTFFQKYNNFINVHALTKYGHLVIN